ncbi:MAG: hypothetical protein ACRDEA_00735, partial [Microcystaceae cyanobacterium]
METNGSNQEVVQGSRATVVYDTPGMEAPNPQEQTANTASDIEERLSSLATAPQEEAAPTVDAPAPTEETKSELPSLDELDIPEDLGVQNTNFETPEAKKLDADLKAILGIGLQDIADGAKSLKEVQQHFQEVQAQQYRTQVLNELTSTWGVTGQELDSRVDAVYERFQKYPPDMQSRLDNLEGIQ